MFRKLYLPDNNPKDTTVITSQKQMMSQWTWVVLTELSII